MNFYIAYLIAAGWISNPSNGTITAPTGEVLDPRPPVVQPGSPPPAPPPVAIDMTQDVDSKLRAFFNSPDSSPLVQWFTPGVPGDCGVGYVWGANTCALVSSLNPRDAFGLYDTDLAIRAHQENAWLTVGLSYYGQSTGLLYGPSGEYSYFTRQANANLISGRGAFHGDYLTLDAFRGPAFLYSATHEGANVFMAVNNNGWVGTITPTLLPGSSVGTGMTYQYETSYLPLHPAVTNNAAGKVDARASEASTFEIVSEANGKVRLRTDSNTWLWVDTNGGLHTSAIYERGDYSLFEMLPDGDSFRLKTIHDTIVWVNVDGQLHTCGATDLGAYSLFTAVESGNRFERLRTYHGTYLYADPGIH